MQQHQSLEAFSFSLILKESSIHSGSWVYDIYSERVIQLVDWTDLGGFLSDDLS